MAVKSLEEQLTRIALKKVKLSNGDTLEQTMAKEAKRLYDCIQKRIDAYYNSYQPKIYKRWFGYKNALHAEDIADIRVVGNTIRISVGFNLKKHSYHANLRYVIFDGMRYYIKDRHRTFVPLMMENGWYAPRLESMIGASVPRLTRFDGTHAVANGIAEFNRTNRLGIKIDADDFFNGKAY